MLKGLVEATGRPLISVNEGRATIDFEPADDPTADELYVAQVTIPGETPGIQPGDPTKTKQPSEPDAPSQNRKARPWQMARPTMFLADGSPTPGRIRLARAAGANLARYERRMASRFIAIFDRQQKGVIAHMALSRDSYGKLGRAAHFTINPDDLLPPPDGLDQAEIDQLLRELLQDRGDEALSDLAAINDAVRQLTINLQASRAAAFLSARGVRVLSLTSQTTRDDLRASLAEGIAASESFDQLVARVNDVFQGRRDNADTIARTEMAAAYNFAANEAWRQSGIDMQQEWLTARDGGERHPSYDGLDGQVRALDEDFDLEGVPSPYPGGSGDPGEDCNCRCTLLPVVPGLTDEGDVEASKGDWWDELASSHLNGNGKPKNRIKELVS